MVINLLLITTVTTENAHVPVSSKPQTALTSVLVTRFTVDDTVARESVGGGPSRTPLGDPGLRGVSFRSFTIFWRRLQPRERKQRAGCVTSCDMEMKMSPRLLPGFGPSWSPPRCSKPLEGRGPGRWQEAHSSPSCLLGKQGLCRPPLPLPAIQSRLPGTLSGRHACVRVSVRVSSLFFPAFIKVAREVKGGGAPAPAIVRWR